MKITSVNLYRTNKQIPFKNNSTDKPAPPVQVVPTIVPVDTTEFKSTVKTPKKTVLTEMRQFFKPINLNDRDLFLEMYKL